MADLLTHTCTAILWKTASRKPVYVGTFVLGTCLPDLLGRVPPAALIALKGRLPMVPEWSIFLWAPLHLPMGMLLWSFAVAFLYAPSERSQVFRQLFGGALLHLFVDSLQRHFGQGYLLFFPFSLWDGEFALFSSEATVRLVPVLLPLTVLLARWRWRGATRTEGA